MDRITEAEIATSVKKHYGMTLLIAMTPIIFMLLIGFYEQMALHVIPLLAPITVVAAVSYFVKNVLTDLFAK
ncbi:hypothetical protein [Alishewanella sp. HH-ZS]|uniref:hypothetical protein n=1 Tax=Alishewanella sp. HH-ZS TaxID=1856684 RepID=UPI0008236C85|nr:hypothetical protein [Alishewanella sp. HH-ZS]OCW93585.1 hypothetical protein A9165_15455 [Alishewanella sp. HH-ZS]